jgi:hypothetical protein
MKVFLTLFFSVLQFSLYAYIKSTEAVPQEFSFMVETLQNYPFSAEETQQLEKEISSLDTHLQYLNDREMAFLLKSELYKGILNFSLGREEIKLEESDKYISNLTTKQATITNPFHQWLISSFKLDLINLTSDKKFQKVIENKKSRTAINSVEERVHFKKVQMILAWASFLSSSNEEELSTTLKPLLLKIVKTTNSRAELFAKLTKFNYSAKNKFPLKYFRLEKTGDKKPLSPSEISQVENLVLPPELNDLPKSNWKPAEDSEKLRSPAPDPNYTPPSVLPKAKASWD